MGLEGDSLSTRIGARGVGPGVVGDGLPADGPELQPDRVKGLNFDLDSLLVISNLKLSDITATVIGLSLGLFGSSNERAFGVFKVISLS